MCGRKDRYGQGGGGGHRIPACIPGSCARACLVLIAVSGIAHADEWSATPSLQVRGQYDDNINLSVASPISVWGASVSPLLDLRKRTATSDYGLGGRLIFNRYSDDSVRDTNIQMLTFTGRSSTRLSRFGLAGSYRRDTIITTVTDEQDDDVDDADGIPDAGDVDVDLVRTQVRRNRLALRPSWTRVLNRTMSLRLGYSLNDTSYSDDAGTSLVDFRRHGLNAALLHDITQRDRLNVGVAVSTYEAPDRGTETDDYTVTAGMTHEFSSLLSGELSVGIGSATTTLNDQEVESNDTSINASLVKKQTEQTTYRVFLGRDLYPSGAGTLVQSDHLRANLSHRVSPKLSLSVWATAFRNRSLDFFSATTDRTYYNVEPSFRWSLTRLWSLDGSYRYRWQKYEDQEDSAASNAVFLAVNYAWPRIAVSR
jgi:hypothetical protein